MAFLLHPVCFLAAALACLLRYLSRLLHVGNCLVRVTVEAPVGGQRRPAMLAFAGSLAPLLDVSFQARVDCRCVGILRDSSQEVYERAEADCRGIGLALVVNQLAVDRVLVDGNIQPAVIVKPLHGGKLFGTQDVVAVVRVVFQPIGQGRDHAPFRLLPVIQFAGKNLDLHCYAPKSVSLYHASRRSSFSRPMPSPWYSSATLRRMTVCFGRGTAFFFPYGEL